MAGLEHVAGCPKLGLVNLKKTKVTEAGVKKLAAALPACRSNGTAGVIEAKFTAAAEEFSFNGHRYRFVPGSLSWDEAKAKAEAMGGHLATITSKEEDQWFKATFNEKLSEKDAYSSWWCPSFEQR